MQKIISDMRIFIFCFALIAFQASAQNTAPLSPFDPVNFGVVLEHPDMEKVAVKHGVNYFKDEKASLDLDIYLPPGLQPEEKRPAVIFLNAIGDRPGEQKVKSWGIYSTWPKLVAAHGFVGISMDSDGQRIPESLEAAFRFLAQKGSAYHVDPDRLGVYAASANVTDGSSYLMGEKAYPGIKAAVLYYGAAPAGPYRKDLPVLFVLSEGDIRDNNYADLWKTVLQNNAPWTIKMGAGMPHAFDSFSDTDEARKIIRETISFWKNHLEPVPPHRLPFSKGREVMAMMGLDREKAFPLLTSLAAEYPEDAPTLAFYAGELTRYKKFDEAEKVYKKVLSLEPGHVHAIGGLATLYYGQDKPAEAEALISKAAKSGLMTQNAYTSLAFSLLVIGKDEAAAKYYEKVVAMRPSGIDYYNLACAYAKSNHTDEALNALKNAVRLGYKSRSQYDHDPDLNSIRADKRFLDLLKELE